MAHTGETGVIGSSLRLDGVNHTVVGVLPAGFHVDGRPADVYVPFGISPEARQWLPVNVYARLKPGVSVEQATAELDSLSISANRGPFPWHVAPGSCAISRFATLDSACWYCSARLGRSAHCVRQRSVPAAGADAIARTRGGGPRCPRRGSGPLMRQLLTESTLLAILGGIAGVAVASMTVRLVPFIAHERLPGLLEQTRMDGVVLGFTLALSVLTGSSSVSCLPL